MLKHSLQRSEDVAFWMKQKASDAIVMTKLDQPLKTIDSAAADTWNRVEKTRINVSITTISTKMAFLND